MPAWQADVITAKAGNNTDADQAAATTTTCTAAINGTSTLEC
jgi:hypothetical protein